MYCSHTAMPAALKQCFQCMLTCRLNLNRTQKRGSWIMIHLLGTMHELSQDSSQWMLKYSMWIKAVGQQTDRHCLQVHITRLCKKVDCFQMYSRFSILGIHCILLKKKVCRLETDNPNQIECFATWLPSWGMSCARSAVIPWKSTRTQEPDSDLTVWICVTSVVKCFFVFFNLWLHSDQIRYPVITAYQFENMFGIKLTNRSINLRLSYCLDAPYWDFKV